MDNIFVNKIAFLLGMFTPLGLGLVRYLSDRFEAKAETADRFMLAKTTSRSFDVVELHCDDEGVIGALKSALQ